MDFLKEVQEYFSPGEEVRPEIIAVEDPTTKRLRAIEMAPVCGDRPTVAVPYSVEKMKQAFLKAYPDLENKQIRQLMKEGNRFRLRSFFCDRLKQDAHFRTTLVNNFEPDEVRRLPVELKSALCQRENTKGCKEKYGFPIGLRKLEELWEKAGGKPLTVTELRKFKRSHKMNSREDYYCYQLSQGKEEPQKKFCELVSRILAKSDYKEKMDRSRWRSLFSLSPEDFQNEIGKIFSPFEQPMPEIVTNDCENLGVPRAFMRHQNFFKYYFTPQNPVKGSLVWLDVGLGKTCLAMAAISYAFESSDYNILWVTRKTLKDAPINSMFKDLCHKEVRKDVKEAYSRSKEEGDALVKKLADPENKKKYFSKYARSKWVAATKEGVTYAKESESAIDDYIVTYKVFENLVTPGGSEARLKRLGLNKKDPLKKTFVVLDEGHNIYNQDDLDPLERVKNVGNIEQAVWNSYAVSGEDSCKLIILTGSPILAGENMTSLTRLLNLLKLPEGYNTEYDPPLMEGDTVIFPEENIEMEQETPLFGRKVIKKTEIPEFESDFEEDYDLDEYETEYEENEITESPNKHGRGRGKGRAAVRGRGGAKGRGRSRGENKIEEEEFDAQISPKKGRSRGVTNARKTASKSGKYRGKLPITIPEIEKRYFLTPGDLGLERFMHDTKGLITYLEGSKQANYFPVKYLGNVIPVELTDIQFEKIREVLNVKKSSASKSPQKAKLTACSSFKKKIDCDSEEVKHCKWEKGGKNNKFSCKKIAGYKPLDDSNPQNKIYYKKLPKPTDEKVQKRIRDLANYSPPQINKRQMKVIDNATFNASDLKKFKENYPKSSNKLTQLVKSIREIDKKDLITYGKLFKYVIYTDLGSNYKGGVKSIATALLSEGFRIAKYKRANRDFVVVPPEKFKKKNDDDVDMKETFMILSSSSFQGPYFFEGKNKEYPATPAARTKLGTAAQTFFNQRPSNTFGDDVRFLVIDSGYKEGVSFFDTMHFVLMEPPKSKASLNQSMGRIARLCGSRGLPFYEGGWRAVFHLLYSYVEVEDPEDGNLEDQIIFQLELNNKESKLDELKEGLIKMSMISSVDRLLTKAVHEDFDRPGWLDPEKAIADALGIP